MIIKAHLASFCIAVTINGFKIMFVFLSLNTNDMALFNPFRPFGFNSSFSDVFLKVL